MGEGLQQWALPLCLPLCDQKQWPVTRAQITDVLFAHPGSCKLCKAALGTMHSCLPWGWGWVAAAVLRAETGQNEQSKSSHGHCKPSVSCPEFHNSYIRQIAASVIFVWVGGEDRFLVLPTYCTTFPESAKSLKNRFLFFFFFKSSFRLTAKLSERYRDFPYIPCPHYQQRNASGFCK